MTFCKGKEHTIKKMSELIETIDFCDTQTKSIYTRSISIYHIR